MFVINAGDTFSNWYFPLLGAQTKILGVRLSAHERKTYEQPTIYSNWLAIFYDRLRQRICIALFPARALRFSSNSPRRGESQRIGASLFSF